MTYMKGILYGLQGDTALAKACIVRLVIAALSVQPPGVNKLFVCIAITKPAFIYYCTIKHKHNVIRLLWSRATIQHD
jgi:hypothetical protein